MIMIALLLKRLKNLANKYFNLSIACNLFKSYYLLTFEGIY